MSDFITLGCPCCGGQLRVTADAERFTCRHCGRDHLVRRQAGHVDLVPVVKKLERITRGMDRNASEMAIKRLKDERKRLARDVDGWRRDLWHAKKDDRSARFWMLGSYITAGPVLLVSISALFAGLRIGGLLGLGLCAAIVLVGAVKHLGLPVKARAVERARKGLNRARDELDDCEAELDYHYDVVQV